MPPPASLVVDCTPSPPGDAVLWFGAGAKTLVTHVPFLVAATHAIPELADVPLIEHALFFGGEREDTKVLYLVHPQLAADAFSRLSRVPRTVWRHVALPLHMRLILGAQITHATHIANASAVATFEAIRTSVRQRPATPAHTDSLGDVLSRATRMPLRITERAGARTSDIVVLAASRMYAGTLAPRNATAAITLDYRVPAAVHRVSRATIELDVASMYPSIIIRDKLCPFAARGTPPLLPAVLSELVAARALVSSGTPTAASARAAQELKRIANTAYGMMGCERCAWSDRAVAQAVASAGCRALATAHALCEGLRPAGVGATDGPCAPRLGRVVHGVTDSVFVELDAGVGEDDVRAVVAAFAASTGLSLRVSKRFSCFFPLSLIGYVALRDDANGTLEKRGALPGACTDDEVADFLRAEQSGGGARGDVRIARIRARLTRAAAIPVQVRAPPQYLLHARVRHLVGALE